jgi:NADH-quinone oxidoreductase subunit F
MKWSFLAPPKPTDQVYLVINADEGEPGTFKDRTIMERIRTRLIEGCIIGCFGIGAHAAYIYVRDELHLSKERLWGAIGGEGQGLPRRRSRSARTTRSRCTSTPARARTSAARRRALLNSLEGKRGEPRLKPPFPAQAAPSACPRR